VFPRATYRAHRSDWEYFVTSPVADPGAVRKLSPLEPQLELFDSDSSIAPGLTARHTPGHTPGSTVYVVSSAGERALLIGDVAHSVVELEEPDWTAVFDEDPEAARAARNALVEEVVDSPDFVAPGHFPNLQYGRIITTGSRRRWVSGSRDG
jgi:glyoxylase-like metal-dependent hydrolase (beta-lactamase superfamily II)